MMYIQNIGGRDSNSLQAGWSGDRIPVEARFSAPVQTGPEAPPTSYTMGTGSFPGVKQLRRRTDHPPPSSAKVKERVELYLYSPSGPSWLVLGVNFIYKTSFIVQHLRRNKRGGGNIKPKILPPATIDFSLSTGEQTSWFA